MARLDARFKDYASYHTTSGNQATHMVGIPMIVLSLLGLLGNWVLGDGWTGSTFFRLDAGILLWAVAMIWYLWMDWKLALPFGLVSLGLYFGGRVLPVGLLWLLFILGWAIQFFGHYHYEKRSPAFYKNAEHLLVGPLWVFAKIVRRSKLTVFAFLIFGLHHAAYGAPSTVGSGPKIGFVLSTMQEERYQRDKKVFEEAVSQLGGQVAFASCDNNEQLQSTQVDQLLAQGVKVLVIQPVNGETATDFVKRAKQNGVAIVGYDRLIKNAPIDAYVTEDSFKVGQLQAEAAIKFTRGKGNFVILMGQEGQSVTEARTAGALSVLKKYPTVNIVVKQYHSGWSPELAAQTVEHALARYKNKIDAVIANNSGMAHGALQALEKHRLVRKVFVAGADADLTAIRDVVSGKQQFEVLISINDMARRAAEIALAIAKKEEWKNDSIVENGTGKIKTVNTPVYPIAKEQIEARIIKSGFHTREAIYGRSRR